MLVNLKTLVLNLYFLVVNEAQMGELTEDQAPNHFLFRLVTDHCGQSQPFVLFSPSPSLTAAHCLLVG